MLCCSFALSIIVSCGVLPAKDSFYSSPNPLDIGLVGEKKQSIHQTEFKPSGVPLYEDYVSVSLVRRNFTKALYKTYLEVSKRKITPYKIAYIDSLEIKPKFVDLVLKDKVLVIKLLNDNANSAVIDYIKDILKTKIVTGIRLVYTDIISQQLENADDIYLRTNQQNRIVMYLFKQGKRIGELQGVDTTFLGYQLSSFCWGMKGNEKIKLSTLVNEGGKCISKTKNDPEKLEKEIIKKCLTF